MRVTSDKDKIKEITTWEEESGLIAFLSTIPAEVARFNDSFGFDIHTLAVQPLDIDGNEAIGVQVGFILERRNPLLPELIYCLYSVLKGRDLYGYIGMLLNGSITTLKELKPVKEFKTGQLVLHEWLGQLVKASCEKIMP